VTPLKRMAALVPNVLGAAPGQRARIELWAPYLEEAGWRVDFYPFESAELHEVLYQSGRAGIKASRLAGAYATHARRLYRGIPCDLLFIYREAALVGPAVLERMAARAGVPVVYDLDDPVFEPYKSPVNGWLSALKFHGKTHSIFRLSDHVIAINSLIGEYVARFNPSVSVIPICLDTARHFPRPAPPAGDDGPVRLVWTGSHSTMFNLQTIAGPIRRLQAETGARLRVVGVGAPRLQGVEVESCQWSAETEMSDLADSDIGLVPLGDHTWNPWKFNFKTVQYMAVGLPVVARRLGSNIDVIDDGVNGFLVETEVEWFDRLRLLAGDRELRRRMGHAARATVVDRYSLQTQMPRMVAVFDRVMESATR